MQTVIRKLPANSFLSFTGSFIAWPLATCDASGGITPCSRLLSCNEAYIKLTGQRNADWQNRAHFFAVASNLMRRILVDYVRRQLRAKRGGGQAKLSLDEVVLLSSDRPDKMLALNQCLTRLEKLDARQSRIVELRYFGGLTIEEAAGILGVSPTTVRREWTSAKAYL